MARRRLTQCNQRSNKVEEGELCAVHIDVVSVYCSEVHEEVRCELRTIGMARIG